MDKKYWEPIKSILWGIAGLVVSLSIISQGRISVIGYPLFVLSILMFILAIFQLVKIKRSENMRTKKKAKKTKKN